MTTQNPLFTIQKYLMTKLAAPINYGHALDLDIANLKAQVAELNITFEHFTGLNVQDAKKLGFSLWDEEQPSFYLIPAWLHFCLPNGLQIYSINKESYTVSEDYKPDSDSRFGCLAFGIQL